MIFLNHIVIWLFGKTVSKEFTNWPPRSSGCNAIVKARFDVGQKAEKLEPTAGEQGLIRALVDGIKIKLLATTLKNVGDLFEDNKPSPPNFLMDATLSNIAVTFVVLFHFICTVICLR